MSQGNSRRGGIGGEIDFSELIEAPVEPEPTISSEASEFVIGITNAVEELVGKVQYLQDQLSQAEDYRTQAETQLAEQRAAIVDHRNALLAMRNDMSALQQRVLVPNLRAAALDIAARIKGPADDARKVANSADIFFEFLTRTPPAPEITPVSEDFRDIEPGTDGGILH